jgi:hypothetical protein
MTGELYRTWTQQQKLKYIEKAVELIGSIDRFRYAERQNRIAFDWRSVLVWWLAPAIATHRPNSRQRASWFEYANRNFAYKFAWGLGSVIGLVTNEMHGDRLLALRLEDWPQTGLPWIVFWLKELITWGTLEPVAAYLLGRGLADTRPDAEAIAEQYHRDVVTSGSSDDPLNAILIRKWVEANVQPVRDAPPQRIPREIPAEPAIDYSGQEKQMWRVLPVSTPEALLWIDIAGYCLARSHPQPNWGAELINTVDFLFDPARSVVASARYF